MNTVHINGVTLYISEITENVIQSAFWDIICDASLSQIFCYILVLLRDHDFATYLIQ